MRSDPKALTQSMTRQIAPTQPLLSDDYLDLFIASMFYRLVASCINIHHLVLCTGLSDAAAERTASF